MYRRFFIAIYMISPLLANIYLHYSLDLWFTRRFARSCSGTARLIRYADDFVVCFQAEADAKRFRQAMEERLNQFGLEIAPEKTQCIEFGVFAIKRAKARGQKAATFDFLGFTHYCSRSRDGKRFRMKRKTISKRLTAKLKAYKGWLKSNRNLTTPEIIQKTVSKLRGHYSYYGVTDNSKGINAYFYEVRGYTLQMAESERQAGVLQLGEICQAVTALSIADTTNHGQSILTL